MAVKLGAEAIGTASQMLSRITCPIFWVMFGDILSDEASMVTGSIGLLPSASMGDAGPALYCPACRNRCPR